MADTDRNPSCDVVGFVLQVIDPPEGVPARRNGPLEERFRRQPRIPKSTAAWVHAGCDPRRSMNAATRALSQVMNVTLGSVRRMYTRCNHADSNGGKGGSSRFSRKVPPM